MRDPSVQSAKDQQQNSEGISRRELLIGAGALASGLVSGGAFAGDHKGHRHEDHAPKHPDLLTAVSECLTKGQLCIAHCLVSFKEGDTTLAQCANKVHEMYAICDAFAYLLAANSTYVKNYAEICITACDDCEKECRKHEEDHVECKDCGDACEKVVKIAKKLVA